MKQGEVLFAAEQIACRVAELASEIRRDTGDRPLSILAILHGSVVFLADLLKHLGRAVNVELIEASSYRGGTAAVRKTVEAMGPRSVRTCVLLDKPSRRKVAAAIDYCGFEVPDVFVVGYGLDYAGRYRDLPHVALLEE